MKLCSVNNGGYISGLQKKKFPTLSSSRFHTEWGRGDIPLPPKGLISPQEDPPKMVI
jgi:hypothetical protein